MVPGQGSAGRHLSRSTPGKDDSVQDAGFQEVGSSDTTDQRREGPNGSCWGRMEPGRYVGSENYDDVC